MIKVRKKILRYIIRHIPYVRYLTFFKLYNIILASFEYFFRRKKLKSRPFIYIIDPSSICNLSCKTCFQSSNQSGQNGRTMTLVKFKQLIDSISAYAVKIKLYNWGEPLLNSELPDMIRYTRSQNIGCEVSTNLQPEYNLDRLMSASPDMLIISLDSLQEGTYCELKKGADFNVLVRNLRKILEIKSFKKLKVWIDIQFIISTMNQKEIPNIEKTLKDLFDTDMINSITLGSLAINLSHKEYKEWLSRTKIYNQYATDSLLTRKINCPWLYFFQLISPEGNVYPCCRVSYQLENCFGQWNFSVNNNRDFLSARGIFSDRKSTHVTVCHRCFGIYRSCSETPLPEF